MFSIYCPCRTVGIREIPAENLKLLRVSALTQDVQRAVNMTPRREVKRNCE